MKNYLKTFLLNFKLNLKKKLNLNSSFSTIFSMQTIMSRISFRSIFMLIVYLALFIYVILRANSLSFTHDESLTYDIIKGGTTFVNTPNNHVLNTLLMKISSQCFGESELALRLPNILAFGIYLMGIFTITLKSKNIGLIILVNSLILFNPFLVDFFSLARGYGLSLGFLMISLFFVLRRNFDCPNFQFFFKDYFLAVSFASLSVLSNLSMINFLISILLIFLFKYIILLRKTDDLSIKLHLFYALNTIFAFISIHYGLIQLMYLKEHNQLYFGTNNMLESLNSIVIGSLYFSNLSYYYFISYTIIAILVFGIISLIIKKDILGRFSIIALLIVFLIFGLLAEHYLFAAKFPSGRTALIYIPLFALFIYYFALHILHFYHPKKIIFLPLIIILSSILICHFFSNINLKFTQAWRYDSHTKDVINILENHANTSNDSLSICSNWLFEPSIKYYIQSRNLKIRLTNSKDFKENADFNYEFEEYLTCNNMKTLAYYNDIHARLLMNSNFKKFKININ